MEAEIVAQKSDDWRAGVAPVAAVNIDCLHSGLTKDAKAILGYVEAELAKKVDCDYFEGKLAEKASADCVKAELAKKADSAYVDSELAKKTNKDYVDAELVSQADGH